MQFPEPCPIDTLCDMYHTRKSYLNVRSMLHRVNSFLRKDRPELDMDYLYPKLWHDECKNICKHLAHHYNAHDGGRQKSIIWGMSGVMTRLMGHEYINPYKCEGTRVADNPYIIDKPKIVPKPKSQKTWEDILPLLEPPYANLHTAIRCILYKHGFAWRTDQVYNTSFKDIQGFNWMDLVGKVCHVRRCKSQKQYTLQLPDALVQDLMKYDTGKGDGWLIPKSNGGRYACTNTLGRHLPETLSDNVAMRHMFQTWMMDKYKDNEEQLKYWNSVMDHKPITGYVYYYDNHDVGEETVDETGDEPAEIEVVEVCYGKYRPNVRPGY